MPPHSLSPGVNSGVQSVENAPSASNTVPPHVFTATARTQAHVENPNPDRSTLLILSESAFTTNGICRARSPPTFQASEPVKGSKTSGNPSEWIVSPLDKSSNWTVRVRSVVQFAAQPAPPKVTQCWHVPSEHSALLEQTCSARGPPMHTPSPIQSDFPYRWFLRSPRQCMCRRCRSLLPHQLRHCRNPVGRGSGNWSAWRSHLE